MDYYLLVNEGMEETAQQEVKELFGVRSTLSKQVLEFSSDPIADPSTIRSARRLLVAVGKFSTDAIALPSQFPWQEHFKSDIRFKVEVENVKGQENRVVLAKKVAGQLFTIFEAKNISAMLELKKPQLLVVVYYNGSDYFVGLDTNISELTARAYRVFPHSGSFKGDLAYFFVRRSMFKKNDKLLIGFCKDGAIPIEAALFSRREVQAFDPSLQNIIAARKNAQLAGVRDLVKIQKIPLDEVDVKFQKNEFDVLIFHITQKDEDKLNEIYHQAKYVLKAKGKALFIGRERWSPSISDKFILLSQGTVRRGNSAYVFWLLEKKPEKK